MPQLSPEPPPYGIAARVLRSPSRGRLFLLGALAVVAVVMVIAIIAAATSSDGPAPSTSPGAADAPPPADSAAAPGESASAASQPAPPPASPPEPSPSTGAGAAAAATGSAAVPSAAASAIDAECQKLQDERKWAELEQCADKLKPLDPRRAADLHTRAVEETKAAPRIAAFEAALRAGDLKRARTELDQVWPGSVDHPKLARDYDAAETQAIAALAAELARVTDAGCQKYNALLAKALTARPPRIAAEAARQTPCAPTAASPAPTAPSPAPRASTPAPPASAPTQPKCDVNALTERGQNQYAAGQYAAALASYEAAHACKPSPTLSEKAFIIACNLTNVPKAKLHWKRLVPAMKTRALGICVRNGIPEAKLNAP